MDSDTLWNKVLQSHSGNMLNQVPPGDLNKYQCGWILGTVLRATGVNVKSIENYIVIDHEQIQAVRTAVMLKDFQPLVDRCPFDLLPLDHSKSTSRL
jgi:hypothetical protein